MRNIRRIFWPIMLLLFVVLYAGAVSKNDGIAVPAFLGMIAWWFTGTFFSRIIGSMLISSIRCKGCGLIIPAVTQWRIGSYNDHRERHFLFAKNPVNGTRLGQIDCPQCSCTIVL